MPLILRLESLGQEKVSEKSKVELLVDKGAKLDEKDNEGKTALDYAISNLYEDIKNYLLKKLNYVSDVN